MTCNVPRVTQENEELKYLAVESLAVYASAARYFVVVAPDAIHKDTGKPVNKASYQRRGWCRLEQWGHMCLHGMNDMYFFHDGNLLNLDDTPDDDGEDWYADSIMVFEGDYTNPENKFEMVNVILGLYGLVVKSLMYGEGGSAISTKGTAASSFLKAQAAQRKAKPMASGKDGDPIVLLYNLIQKFYPRVFPTYYFGDLPAMMQGMLSSDPALKDFIKNVSTKQGSAMQGPSRMSGGSAQVMPNKSAE